MATGNEPPLEMASKVTNTPFGVPLTWVLLADVDVAFVAVAANL